MMRRLPCSSIPLVALLAWPVGLGAQIRASELGSVSQVIDGTKITIQYSRPRARERSPLFGGKVVHWDETWTPGANWATTFEVSKGVTLNAKRVPKGTYSVWMAVRKSGEWTVVLDPKARRFHEDPPDSSSTQIRFPVRAQEAPYLDVLTWSMPELRIDGATIAMQWGTTKVSMNLEVEPSLQVAIAEADAAPFLGRYDYIEKDSAGPDKKSVLIVTYEDGTLKGQWDPNDSYFKRFALIRIAPDWFVPGLYDKKGQIYEVLRPDLVFEFARKSGRVTSLEVRDEDDKVFATAERKP